MTTWQPFSTAPKDGEIFLAVDSDDGGGIFMGVVACKWEAFDPEYPEYEEGFVVTEIGGDAEHHGCNLTHWMPLPALPAPEKFT